VIAAERSTRRQRRAEADQARCQLDQHARLRAAEDRGDRLLPHLARWLDGYTPDRREADERTVAAWEAEEGGRRLLRWFLP
jgi:hypothetical protein